MKKFRKIMAVLVAAVLMISSFTLTAFAANTDYKIIIKNALNKETYSAYKIFDASLAGTLVDAYVSVPKSSINLDENKKITYYKKVGDNYEALTDAERAQGTGFAQEVYELVKKPVSYTMEFSNPWYTRVAAYAAGSGSGLKLTPIASSSTTYLVEFTESVFNPALFARDLKTYYDGVTAGTITPNPGFVAADSKPGSNGTVADGTVQHADLTLNVGEVNGSEQNAYKGPGYYFVDTSTGSFCALDTTTKDAEIYEKNSTPVIDKKVWHSTLGTGSDAGSWSDYEESQIGDTVYFKITVTDGLGTDTPIVVYDDLSDGLTFGSDVTVYKKAVVEVGTTVVTGKYVLSGKTPEAVTTEEQKAVAATDYYDLVANASTNYTVGSSGSTTDNNGAFAYDFTVTFPADYVKNSLTTNDEVVICYSATLNTTNAVIYGDANTNKTFLSYASQKTQTITRNVYTYDAQIVKYDGEDADKKMLSGAVFNLYRGPAEPWSAGAVSGTPMKFTATSSTYRVDDAGDAALTISTAAPITIEGLDADTYYLIETQAPAGYKPLTAPIKIVVSQDSVNTNADVAVSVGERQTNGTITYGAAANNSGDAIIDGTKWTSDGIAIANTPGKELPSTGGMGTTVLYIVGGMLVILAGAYLFFSRKRA